MPNFLTRLLEPEEDAQLAAQVTTMLANDPANALHAASIDTARNIYTDSLKLTVASTYQPALRRLTADEDIAVRHGALANRELPAWAKDDREALSLARRTGLVAPPDGARQLRVELERSGLVALTVPASFYAGHMTCAVWEGLKGVAASAPAMQSADTNSVTLLFARNVGAVRRRLELDVSAGVDGLERIRPSGDQSNVLPLPHADTLERWLRLPRTAPPQLPVELAALLAAEAAPSDLMVTEWLQDHYRAAKRGEHGLSRDDVYQAILAANNWLPTDFDVHCLSRGFAGSGFESRRLASGIEWRIVRDTERAPALRSVRGVSVETIDPVELAAFRSWRASLEVTPARQRERAEQAAAAAARAEQAAHLARMWGSQEVFDQLLAENYIAYHRQAEARRYKGGAAFGEEFVALNFSGAVPDLPGRRIELPAEAWQLSPPGTPPAERYRKLVEHYIQGSVKP